MRRAALLMLVGTLGCAGPSVLVDGYSLNQRYWEEMSLRLRSRAAFDMECPPEELAFQVLAARTQVTRPYATQVGVIGCGQRRVYVYAEGTWVLNSEPAAGQR